MLFPTTFLKTAVYEREGLPFQTNNHPHSSPSFLGSSVLAAEFELGDFLTLPVYTNFYLIHTWIF